MFSITQMLVKCFENNDTCNKQKTQTVVVFNGAVYSGVIEKEVFILYGKCQIRKNAINIKWQNKSANKNWS